MKKNVKIGFSRQNPASRFLWTIMAALMIILVQACATTEKTSDTLKDRAQARWNAILTGDFETAYGYLSPGYRSTVSAVDYEIGLRTRRVNWIGAEYQEHSCDGDVCSVDVLVKYKVMRPVPGVNEFKLQSIHHEKWVRIDGDWWFLPEK